jgi:hypothetical protein
MMTAVMMTGHMTVDPSLAHHRASADHPQRVIRTRGATGDFTGAT